MGSKTKKGEVTSVQEKQNVFEAIPNLEPASLRGCIKTACGGYIRTFQGVPKSLPKKEVHLLGLKHLNTAVLSQVPTRQTLSPNVPDRIAFLHFGPGGDIWKAAGDRWFQTTNREAPGARME